MKVAKSLSKAQRQSLALFYEQPSFEALKSLIGKTIVVLAEKALEDWQMDDKLKVYAAGKAAGMKEVLEVIEEINKEENKR